jgi:hypothetical protein
LSSDGIERLRALLLEEGGLMATLVARPGGPTQAGVSAHEGAGPLLTRERSRELAASPAALAADGPRTRGQREEYELLLETIYEGYLLHYGSSRVLRVPEADLGLLAGDQLYALGLARLVALGDTVAVAELADTITLSALAHGAGEAALAEAVWAAGARAVGWGSSEAHRRAKELAFAGAPQAIEAMRTSAARVPASP